jgi:RNA-directed DNA polymerase
VIGNCKCLSLTRLAFSNDLLDAVLQRTNLQQAWKQVRANEGAAGVDGMTIDEFPVWVKVGHWTVVEQSIRSDD